MGWLGFLFASGPDSTNSVDWLGTDSIDWLGSLFIGSSNSVDSVDWLSVDGMD